MPKLKFKTVLKYSAAVIFVGVCAIGLNYHKQPVKAISGSQFQAGRIIDDAIFQNSNSMSVQDIQNFLNSKVPSCDTNGTGSYSYYYDSATGRTSGSSSDGHDSWVTTSRATFGQRYDAYYKTNIGATPYVCLKSYIENTSTGQNNLHGNSVTGGISAAHIIYNAAQSYNINPAVLIVTLQKEQGLVTDTWPWVNQYQEAMGYMCPDTPQGCNSSYAGFYKQVDDAAWQFRHYLDNQGDPGNYWVGDYYIPYNPSASCGGSVVHIQTEATAALYDYTPYQPNSGSLAGVSDSSPGGSVHCGAYGNRNFWWYFNEWFGSSLTNILFKVSGSSTYYLDWGGYYYAIPSSSILKAYGLANISPSLRSSFPSNETRGPNLSGTAQFGTDATFYVIDNGRRYAAPNWTVFGAYGYSTNPPSYPDSLSWLLDNGGVLNLVARQPNGAIFLMQNGQKRGFPDWQTFSTLSGPNDFGANQVYSQQQMTNLSSDYIGDIPDGAPMLLDGKFISDGGSPAIYLYDGGKKYIFSPSSYSAWGGRADYRFPSDSMSQITNGPSAPVLVSSASGNKYLVDSGKKKSFSASTEAAWGLADGQFIQVSDSALARLQTTTASTLLSSGAGVYSIAGGQKHGIAGLEDFSMLGFSWKNVDSVSKEALNLIPSGPTLFAPSSLVRTPNGAVYLVNSNYGDLGITSGDLFSAFGFSWHNVRNVGSTALAGYAESPLQTLLQDNSSSKYYLVDSGVRHYVDSTAFGASEYNMTGWTISQVDTSIANSIKSGSQLTQFIRGSGPTVFYVQNGQRRAITSEAELFTLGGSWSKVVSVSDGFLSSITRGSAI